MQLTVDKLYSTSAFAVELAAWRQKHSPSFLVNGSGGALQCGVMLVTTMVSPRGTWCTPAIFISHRICKHKTEDAIPVGVHTVDLSFLVSLALHLFHYENTTIVCRYLWKSKCLTPYITTVNIIFYQNMCASNHIKMCGWTQRQRQKRRTHTQSSVCTSCEDSITQLLAVLIYNRYSDN